MQRIASETTLVSQVHAPAANPTSSTQPSGITEIITLRLAPRRKKKAVKWAGDVVDNEHLNKRSSKKCCIFHKQQPFGEWSDDESEMPCRDT
ncbi:g7138 [Coccomyxa viridis]|uniref:G7138 protein n=1 Tax=Coccomyxa viridis TaxID=1274662 RepID=A0ABP1FZM6_9CHLO